jgi:sialate O-acetylesterase
MISLSPLWSSGAVLQHSRPQQLQGSAAAKQRLQMTLQCQHKHHQVEAHTDRHGEFCIEIPPEPPSGPWTLCISDGVSDNIRLEDLWFGHRVICAGQSNIGWPLRQYPAQLAVIQSKLGAASSPPLVRAYVTGAYDDAGLPADFTGAGRWQTMTAAQCAGWPALLCFFSEHYQTTENASPIMLGLVDVSWPGSAIDAWTHHSDGPNARHAWQAGALFAGRLAPWLHQPFSALLWYQGEQDAMGKHAARYGERLQLWLQSCRHYAGWEFPLLLVQIAGFGQSKLPAPQQGFVQVRLAQQQIAASNRHCLLVSAADLGAGDAIHPPFKAELARRLVLSFCHQINGLLLAQLLSSEINAQQRDVLLQLPAAQWHCRPQNTSMLITEGAIVAGFYTDDVQHGWQAVPARFSAGQNQLRLRLPARARLLVYGLMPNPVLTLYTAEGLPLLPQSWPLAEPAC